jgi:DNA-binding response OmpR family regulator
MEDKVLAVDDELQMRDLLNLFLTRDGYDVLLASNGEDAIELAKKENPQIILLDIKMPGIDGIEACRRLKADRKTQSYPDHSDISTRGS